MSAISAFIGKKVELDALITKLQAASADHFSADPDAVNWGDVGSLTYAVDKLVEITQFLDI